MVSRNHDSPDTHWLTVLAVPQLCLDPSSGAAGTERARRVGDAPAATRRRHYAAAITRARGVETRGRIIVSGVAVTALLLATAAGTLPRTALAQN
ncbi:MAG TPA: hypothetical protein QGH10_04385 [Armatimonadota bacterium]|nr:hypothetical protein [Armatimonadota bacterium]